MQQAGPIGVFDSGYGGLTVLKDILKKLPAYDYIYLGDNARAPYGNRSFETIYQYTQQAVHWFFEQGCSLVILACNTASAKALRTIQQNDLSNTNGLKKVLGVLRPTTEIIGTFTETRQIGILATNGTVASNSYPVEIKRFYPDVEVYQEACPMWVPLIENNEHAGSGADFFVKKNLQQIFQKGEKIDVLLLACTHYPLIKEKIEEHLPIGVQLVSQGEIVAESLANYLQRHPEIETVCSKNSNRLFYTTDSVEDFNNQALAFLGERVSAQQAIIES